MEYKLISDSCYGFDFEVNKHLQEGWQLHGPTQVILDDKENCFYYFQAMIRIEQGGAE